MTHRFAARCVLGLCFVLPLAACAGSPSVDNTAAQAGVSSAQHGGGQPSTADSAGTGGNRSAGNGSGGGGHPGAPGADPADGGGGGGVVAQGNPGAPGDVAVFEEGGNAPYSALVDDAATKCVDGVCTLGSPIILDGHVDRVAGGVGDCTIANKTDILYDPPAQGGLFPKGATVRAQVHCADVETPVDNTNGDTPAGGDSAGATSSGATSGGTTSGGTTPDTGSQPQG